MNALSPWLYLLPLALLLPVYIFSEYREKSPWVRLALKAACSLLFVLAASSALAGEQIRSGWQPGFGWFAAAFVLCAIGDVLLSWPGEASFLPGLGAFLLSHCAFTAGFLLRWGLSPWDAAAFAGLAGAALFTLVKAPGMEYGQTKTPSRFTPWRSPRWRRRHSPACGSAGARGRCSPLPGACCSTRPTWRWRLSSSTTKNRNA